MLPRTHIARREHAEQLLCEVFSGLCEPRGSVEERYCLEVDSSLHLVEVGHESLGTPFGMVRVRDRAMVRTDAAVLLIKFG